MVQDVVEPQVLEAENKVPVDQWADMRETEFSPGQLGNTVHAQS